MLFEYQNDVSLRPFNTFGMDVNCTELCEITNEDIARKIILSSKFKNKSFVILGGGSNVLFTDNFEGLVLLNKIEGLYILFENDKEVVVEVGAGVGWHDFVLYCIAQNWGGVENLSLIPGSVGASPMQNIGAYGVEVKDVFYELQALHLETGEIHYFKNEDCKFGYRESVFKNELKDKYLITRVTFKLTKNNHVLNTSYGAIEDELNNMGVEVSTIKDVSNAVIKIRQSKLPNPAEIGNAGSFFKNPVIGTEHLNHLISLYPNIVYYPVNEEEVKVAAGWLIDSLGWKGKTFGNYGVHKNQALVLVNYGGAKGKDILNLSEQIIQEVMGKYNIRLEREVNIY